MSSPDKRQFPRFRVDPEWELEIEIAGVSGVVILHEVGAGGCGLFTDDESLEEGKTYSLAMRWPSNDIDRVELEGKLVYRVKRPQHINSNLYYCGFQIKEDDREKLQEIVGLLHDLIDTQA